MITQEMRDQYEKILAAFEDGELSEQKATDKLLALGVDLVQIEEAISICKGGSDVVAIEKGQPIPE